MKTCEIYINLYKIKGLFQSKCGEHILCGFWIDY